MHVLSQRSLARGRPSYSKVVDLRDLWEESLLLGSHAKNMKSRLEVDERRELPSAICSENGPFDVTHRQNFWRSANVRGWVGRHPRKEFPDLSIHGMEILVERIFRAFSTFVLINSRSTINRVARRIINELASSERLLVPSTWVGKQSRRKWKFTRARFDRDRPTRSNNWPSCVCFRLRDFLLDRCQRGNPRGGNLGPAPSPLLSPP